MCYPFKTQNRGSQLRANPENCTDESRAWQNELLQEKKLKLLSTERPRRDVGPKCLLPSKGIS